MEIPILAKLHVEHENKWKIWKIKITYIGYRHMAKRSKISGTYTTPFSIDLFDDVMYISFINKWCGGGNFIKIIHFPKCDRKIILGYLKEIVINNPSAVSLHDFKGMPAYILPKD